MNLMNALSEPTAKKIARLLRLFGSNFEGEAVSALMAMKRLVASEGLSFNDIATVIENHQGEIEEKKFSDTDADIIFARGMEKGRVEEARKRDLPPDFYDADGCPQWHSIALFCQKNHQQLRDDWERTFIDDMAGKTVYREPSEKQAKYLLAIFIRLGGRKQ
jgi:hypothetical protein